MVLSGAQCGRYWHYKVQQTDQSTKVCGVAGAGQWWSGCGVDLQKSNNKNTIKIMSHTHMIIKLNSICEYTYIKHTNNTTLTLYISNNGHLSQGQWCVLKAIIFVTHDEGDEILPYTLAIVITVDSVSFFVIHDGSIIGVGFIGTLTVIRSFIVRLMVWVAIVAVRLSEHYHTASIFQQTGIT